MRQTAKSILGRNYGALHKETKITEKTATNEPITDMFRKT
jgi:hypothetical protein